MLTQLAAPSNSVHLPMNTCRTNGTEKQHDFTVKTKIALLRKRLTVTELARKLKLHRTGVSRAINDPSSLPTVAARIKKELALS